jgi:trigger factor
MNWTKKENSTGVLTVSVDGQPWEKACGKAFNKLKANLHVKGFRPGQVPEAVAKKQIPAHAIYEQAAGEVASQALEDGIKAFGLDLVARPVLDIEKADENGCTLKFDCVVSPEVTLGDWKAIKAEEKPVEVTDEEVDQEIQKLQERYADWVLREEDQPAQEGDQVTIDFVGEKDGVPFEGGAGENYPLVLGSHTFIPGFEEQLIGIKPEEEKAIEVTFPENYQAQDLAGQPVIFKVKAHDIRFKELPAADDELVKLLKTDGLETLDQYKAQTKERLEASKKKEADQAFTNDILNQLVAGATVDIPQVMIDNEVNRLYRDFEQQVAQAGFTADQFFQATHQTEEEVRKSMEPEALNRVKLQLVLEALAEAMNIEITEDEINAEYDTLASMYGMPAEQIKTLIYPEQIIFNLKQQKALDGLKASAKE